MKRARLMVGVATASLLLTAAALGQTTSAGSTGGSRDHGSASSGRERSSVGTLGSGPSNDPSGVERSTTAHGDFAGETTAAGQKPTTAPDADSGATNASASSHARPLKRRHHRRHKNANSSDGLNPDS